MTKEGTRMYFRMSWAMEQGLTCVKKQQLTNRVTRKIRTMYSRLVLIEEIGVRGWHSRAKRRKFSEAADYFHLSQRKPVWLLASKSKIHQQPILIFTFDSILTKSLISHSLGTRPRKQCRIPQHRIISSHREKVISELAHDMICDLKLTPEPQALQNWTTPIIRRKVRCVRTYLLKYFDWAGA